MSICTYYVNHVVDDVFPQQLHLAFFTNMAENSATVAKMARILAKLHIIVGSLLICFGIADLAVQYFYTGYYSFGIWTGVWVSCAYVYFNAAHAVFNSK